MVGLKVVSIPEVLGGGFGVAVMDTTPLMPELEHVLVARGATVKEALLKAKAELTVLYDTSVGMAIEVAPELMQNQLR